LFARYLDTSADGLFGLMLGPESERVVAKAYVVPDHDLSFEHVTFAVREDIVVGMVSAYSSEQHGRSTDAPLKRAAGWRIIRLGAVSVAVGRVLRFLGDIPDGDFYLQAVALDSESQGEGVGTVLIEHAQNRAMENQPIDSLCMLRLRTRLRVVSTNVSACESRLPRRSPSPARAAGASDDQTTLSRTVAIERCGPAPRICLRPRPTG
jgi:ribosomal protein S18 acetylase RimI-like enzyme